jgi:hypothetical protein
MHGPCLESKLPRSERDTEESKPCLVVASDGSSHEADKLRLVVLDFSGFLRSLAVPPMGRHNKARTSANAVGGGTHW